LVTVEERGQHATTIDADGSPSISVPVTVLVNQYTASASEITAGALQDDGIGTLVGARTFGKGVMQTLTPLPDGAAIKITTAHYLTPNRRDINLRGIDPDLRVDENRDAHFGEIDKDAQLRAAIDLLQKKIAVRN
jgi:carboxyl-terminal processing protease